MSAAISTSSPSTSFLPPGLEDSMMPAKVDIGPSLALQSVDATPCYAPSYKGSGEWVQAVLAVAPYLDAHGLHEALAILDRAVGNVQQAKALDGMIEGSAGLGLSSMPQLLAAEMVRAQVCEQQEQLLRQLHQLRARATGEVPSVAALTAMASKASAACAALPMAGCAPPGAFPPGPGEPFARGHAAMAERVLGALGHVTGAPRGTARPDEASKGAARTSTRQPSGVQTLSTSLQLLTNEDPDSLFIVRRMNKLGFKASRKLKQHFGAYGTVARVLVAHSTVRQHGDPQCHARRRPSSLGFVQMASAAAVKEVLAMGPEQEVDGALIRVQKFERQHAEQTADQAYKEDDATKDWERQRSDTSNASTATSASTAALGLVLEAAAESEGSDGEE